MKGFVFNLQRFKDIRNTDSKTKIDGGKNITIAGDKGKDTIYSNNYKGNDDIEKISISGGNGDDSILTSGGEDVIVSGGSGNDTIQHLNGEATLKGSSKNNTLVSVKGNDTLIGGKGNDIFFVHSNGNDVITDYTADAVNSATDARKNTIATFCIQLCRWCLYYS